MLVYVPSVAQKYLSFMLRPQEKVRVVSMKGLQHVDTQTMDAASYLDPKLHPGKH